MKKNIPAVVKYAILLTAMFSLNSCLKDNCRHSYKIFTPVYKKLSELRTAVQSTASTPVTNTGKIYVKDKWIFLNEQNKGIHVIDNSNPTRPVQTSFINIPGNIDMYVRDNILYADLYCDFLAADITNPKNISVKKYLTNTFPDRAAYTTSTNPDSINIITDWQSRDTVVDCSVAASWNNCPNCNLLFASSTTSSTSGTKSTSGSAGSMARFAAVNNYMYTVTNSTLNVIDINTAANPSLVQKKNIGWNIETIFPYNNKLYIGAASTMGVYDLQDPLNPVPLSWSGHWCSHDPVVADDNYAYITLHAANFCGSAINELEIYDLKTPNTPALLKTYALTSPQGLSKDGNLLFICDGADGLKVYDATDINNLKLIKQLSGLNAYDVISTNGIAYVVGGDGLYQFDYSDIKNIHLLSKLSKD